MHNILFCPRTLYMNYLPETFLLVSSSVGSKQLLCFMYSQAAKKVKTKNITKTFVGFYSHSPLLTMLW